MKHDEVQAVQNAAVFMLEREEMIFEDWLTAHESRGATSEMVRWAQESRPEAAELFHQFLSALLQVDEAGLDGSHWVYVRDALSQMSAEHADAGAQHIHRPGVLGRGFQKINDFIGQRTQRAQRSRYFIELRLRWKRAAMQQVKHLLEGAVLGEIVDIVTEVAQHAVEPEHLAELRFVGDDTFEAFGILRSG